MKESIFIALLLFTSLNAQAEPLEFLKEDSTNNYFISETKKNIQCTYYKSKIVSFSGLHSKDTFEVSVKGDNCKSSKLELKLISENGTILHTYEASFNRWHWPEKKLPEKVLAYANRLFEKSITTTASLPIKFRCEIEEPNCMPFERNIINMDAYLKLRKSESPMISHATYYEGWASWVYDNELNKMKKVYEGGL